MAISSRIMAATICLAVLVIVRGIAPLQAFREDSEKDLLTRIQREHDPVKKAKYEIRLARLKLIQGAAACEKDDHDSCSKSLSGYLGLMKNSWKDLKSSGRNAVKQPSGFKELDIALREDEYTLDDLKRRMPIEDVGGIDPVIREVKNIHDADFAALFPGGAPPPRKGRAAPRAARHFVTGRIR